MDSVLRHSESAPAQRAEDPAVTAVCEAGETAPGACARPWVSRHFPAAVAARQSRGRLRN